MTIRQQAFLGLPLDCPVIDAHTHLGTSHLNGWHQKFDRIDTKSILEDVSRLGIDCIVTAPHPLVTGEMELANMLAAQAAEDFKGKIYGYICIVPSCGMDAVRQEIKKYSANPSFIGFKFLTGYHGDLLQPEYEYAMDFANEMNCPVLCHEYDNIPDRKEFIKAVEKRHNMKLIIAHQGGGYALDTKDCAPIVRENPNVYMELCGSLDNSLSVDEIVNLVGEDKLIFGTDAINLDPKYDFGKVAFCNLDDTVKKKIFAENYLSLLEDSQMGKIVF